MSSGKQKSAPSEPTPAADPELLAMVDKMRDAAAAKAAASPSQLTFWPEKFRGIPNEPARSALFTVRRGKREYIKDQSIVVIGDGEIIYRGEELRTEDEDVWLSLLHLARSRDLDAPVVFRPYALLRELGWPTNGTYYKRLEEIIRRLKATMVQIRSARLAKSIGLSLIKRFEMTGEGGEASWQIWIEREMRILFAGEQYTRLHWETRKQMTPVAKRLMDYFCSHKRPHPISVIKLKDLCSSTTKSLRHWRETLRGALEELKQHGVLTSWSINDHDNVEVVRAPMAQEPVAVTG